MDLLQHEVAVAALLGGLHAPGHCHGGLRHRAAVYPCELELVFGHVDDFAVFYDVDLPSVGKKRRDVGGDVVLPLADTDYEQAIDSLGNRSRAAA